MNCRHYHQLIHEFLDDHLDPAYERQLNDHLKECSACRGHFLGLQKSVAFVQSSSHIYAPVDFTEAVLARLPKETFSYLWKNRFKRHPVLVAASLFIFLMTGSLFSYWTDRDQHLQLSANRAENLQIDKKHNMIIVPAGTVVDGDLVVRNANISVRGTVKGNVVAIDGRIFMASTGAISGEKEEIHQAVEWAWYNIKNVLHQLIP